MAKVTHLDSLPPDDPIFSAGPQIYSPVSRPSTTTSAEDTDGTSKGSQEDPMREAREMVEVALMELASRDLSAPSEPADSEQEEKS
jgi:hypothetical protein